MKIRWYHWLVYKLFRYYWNPILRKNYSLRKQLIKHMVEYDSRLTDFKT